MNKYRKNVIAASASFPKEPHYHHCIPVAQVKYGTIHLPPEQKGHALTFITCTTELDKEFNYG
jgi:hypothetical protein